MSTKEKIVAHIFSVFISTLLLGIVFWFNFKFLNEQTAKTLIFIYFVWIMSTSVVTGVKDRRKIKQQEYLISQLKEELLKHEKGEL